MRRIPLLIWLLVLPGFSSATNLLQSHSSPYLAMHANDPVKWQTWGPPALQEARREDRLLFVSIGYFSCYWCHVMQKESYQNTAIAALLNRDYVSIKVDRELEPALDARLVDFVQRTRGSAGWPLNVFLTPEGYPLVGASYQPPQEFRQLLAKLQARWTEDKDALRSLAREVDAELRGQALTPTTPGDDTGDPLTQFVEALMVYADQLAGGFGDQSKFPMVPQLLALLYARQALTDSVLKQETNGFLQLTFERMATQGLHDLVGGGFYRYTVDPNWQQPHFEKMLYGNALLALLYLEASRVFQVSRWKYVATETLDFMLREMSSPTGGFIAAFSSVDGEGREGGYYLWQPQELELILSAGERRAIERAWSWSESQDSAADAAAHATVAGELPVLARPTPAVAKALGLPVSNVRELISRARHKLYARRAERAENPADAKLLAAWNGLALVAFSRAAAATGDERYQQAARRIQQFLRRNLWDKAGLKRAASGQGVAAIEDYAYVAWGLWEYARLTDAREDYDIAGEVLWQGWRRFHSKAGWRMSEGMLLPPGQRQPYLPDGPMPSPSAVMIRVSMDFAKNRSDTELEQLATSALQHGHLPLLENALWNASQVIELSRTNSNPLVTVD